MKFLIQLTLIVLIPQMVFAQNDIDSDGIADESCVCIEIDNCQGVYNPTQDDCDSDGYGNECDLTPGCPDTDTGDLDTDTDTGIDETGIYWVPDFSDDVKAKIREIVAMPFERTPNTVSFFGNSIMGGGGIIGYNNFMYNCNFAYGDVNDAYSFSRIKDLTPYNHLEESLDYMLTGEVDGENFVTHDSLGAEGGRTATWAIGTGNCPALQEIDEMKAQTGVIYFGTNMYYGIDPQDDSKDLENALDIMAVADYLAERGVVPIVVSPAAYSELYDRFEALNELLEIQSQLANYPFVSNFEATKNLDYYGNNDATNKHPQGMSYNRMCVFSEEALEYGSNTLILGVLQGIHQVYEVLSE